MIQALLVTICIVVFPYQGSSIVLESGNVNDYEVVYPQQVPVWPKGGHQNAVPKTKYEDTLKYEFKVNGEPVVLHLERNKGLFSEDYSETHYSPDGREITTTPSVQDHCYYHGHLQNDPDSSAVISACNGLKGHFNHQGETYFIEPLKLSDSEAHAIYKYDSLEKEDETPKTCGVPHTTWESDESIEMSPQRTYTFEEAAYLNTQKYIELFIVVDNLMYKKYSGNLNTITTRVYEIANGLNKIYRALGIHIALIGIEIWSHRDMISVQSDVDVTVDLFGNWRKTVLLPRRNHDNAQLLTGINFNGQTVGYGYVGSLCKPKDSSAIVQDHSKLENVIASTMAHEMGHNLGIEHDTGPCVCQPKKCIMAPTISYEPSFRFSACSVDEHRQYLLDERPECILNKPLRTDIITPAVCGNDFVEVGEECDCGPRQFCQSNCCNSTTCKLNPGAQCDSEECCENCQFKRATVQCRAVKDDCDVAEHCTGRSAECPPDQLQRNGQSCQNDQGYCYNGKCPTLAKQCIDLSKYYTGDYIGAPDGCFELNHLASGSGYCQGENNSRIKCAKQDVKCGTLWCHSRDNDGKCHYLLSLNNQDKVMADSRVKCGDQKVCNNGRCVNTNTVY